MENRVCKKCKVEKPITEFYFTGKNNYYRQSSCKSCMKVYKIEYWRKNKKHFDKLGLLYQKTPKGKYYTARVSAKRKKVPFTISREFFISLCLDSCSFCGEKPAMGVDRIRPKFGYIFGNVQSCCFRCNRGKFTETEQEYINHCFKVVNYLQKKEGERYGRKNIDYR